MSGLDPDKTVPPVQRQTALTSDVSLFHPVADLWLPAQAHVCHAAYDARFSSGKICRAAVNDVAVVVAVAASLAAREVGWSGGEAKVFLLLGGYWILV